MSATDAEAGRRPVAGKRVLVTGAGGFLGTHLCPALVRAGAQVFAVSRKVAPALDDGVTRLSADCSNADSLRAVFRAAKPELIYHLAGSGNGSPALSAVLPTLQDDLVTSVNVLTLATEQGFERMVLVASLEEPRQIELPPLTPYAAAKACTTSYVRMFQRIFDAPITQVRAFMTYGPGQRPHKIIPSVILSLLAGKAPELRSGERPVDWIYVDDVIDGMIAAAEWSGVEGLTLELGSGEAVKIRDVVEKVVKLLGSPLEPRFAAPSAGREEVVRLADVTQAREKLRWTPSVSLDAGLGRTIAWYEAQPRASTEGPT